MMLEVPVAPAHIFRTLSVAVVTIALILVSSAASAVTTDDEIALLDAGVEPHHTLHYAPEVGAGEIMVLRRSSRTFTLDGEARYPSGSDPTYIINIDSTAHPAEAGRILHIQHRVTGGRVEADATTSRHILRMLGAQMEAMHNLRIQLLGDAKAVSMAVNPLGEDDTGPMLTARLREEGQWLRLALAPLPAEPVGVGATWQWRRTLREGGISYEDITEYKLENIAGDVITLKVSIVRVAADQTLQPEVDPENLDRLPPAARDAMKAKLRTAETVGEGEWRINLRKPFASEVELILRTRQQVAQGATGQERTTDIETVERLRLLPTGKDVVKPWDEVPPGR